MTKRARSARGELVDFDLLKIKQQLATTPVPVGVEQRRKFIDEKDGIKSTVRQVAPAPAPELPSALAIAMEAVQASEQAAGEASEE
jgi:hypothetical protein